MGVFDHDYTRDMLDDLGIHTIIPLSVCLDHKYDSDGSFPTDVSPRVTAFILAVAQAAQPLHALAPRRLDL